MHMSGDGPSRRASKGHKTCHTLPPMKHRQRLGHYGVNLKFMEFFTGGGLDRTPVVALLILMDIIFHSKFSRAF